MDEDLQEIYDTKLAGDHDRAERLWNHYKAKTRALVNEMQVEGQKARAFMKKTVCDLLSCEGNHPNKECNCKLKNYAKGNIQTHPA